VGIDPSASAAEQYAYRLRLHRERAELTQDDVGRECLISGKMIGHFENCDASAALANQDGAELPGAQQAEHRLSGDSE
jgi:hypothetical protein